MHRVHALVSTTVSRRCKVFKPPVFVLVDRGEVVGHVIVKRRSQVTSEKVHSVRLPFENCSQLTSEQMLQLLTELQQSYLVQPMIVQV